MKAKVKLKKDKKLYINMKLGKLFKRVKERGEEILYVKIDDETQVNFILRKEGKDAFVVFTEDGFMHSKSVPKFKVIRYFRHMLKIMARKHGYDPYLL